MKQKHFILAAAIVAALASTASLAAADNALGLINTGEAPRITQTVDNSDVRILPASHLGFLAKASTSTVAVADTAPMQHLQLILKPSAARTASLAALIANQHNPKSAQFQKWLTPKQYGDTFGVLDSDIAAVTAWLTSQGFTVNNVYPNKTQIDFTGTAAQVRQAREPLGSVVVRSMKNSEVQKNPPGAPPGDYVLQTFETTFSASTTPRTETLPLIRGADGRWRAVGYFIR